MAAPRKEEKIGFSILKVHQLCKFLKVPGYPQNKVTVHMTQPVMR